MKDEEAAKSSILIEASQFNALIRTMENLVKVFAAAQIKSDRGTEKNARFLRVFGLTQQEIADILGTTQSVVSEALSEGKTKRAKGKMGTHGTGESSSG
jgi:predicted transcriptional regulator